MRLPQDWGWIKYVADSVAERIRSGSEEIIGVLTTYETWRTAEDEVLRSVNTLNGIEREWKYIKRVAPGVVASSFLPVNQPLYALILFGVVPALIVRQVNVRPARTTAALVEEVWDKICVPELLGRLRIRNVGRQDFGRDSVSKSDAVLFTGTHAAARTVIKRWTRPGSTFVFNGSGVNPVVVLPDADIERAVSGIVAGVTYNSGQDCAAPKCVLVHAETVDKLVGALSARILRLRTGNTEDPSTDVGPLARRSSIERCVDFLLRGRDHVVTGGSIDVPRRVVEPTLVVSRLDADFSYPELYAPVFNVGVFEDPREVRGFTESDRYQRNAMYATVYGTLEERLSGTQVLREETVLEKEEGNLPFGGTGAEASFVKTGGNPPVRGPVLVSAALAGTAGRGAGD